MAKSYSIKIGADTTEFIKGLKAADKEIKVTEKEVNELQKGLALKFDTNRFKQAQDLAQKSLSLTEQKADALRKQIAYLEKTGNIDTEGYKKLQLELAKTETKALSLKNKLEEINALKLANLTKGIDSVSKSLSNAANYTKALSVAATGAIAGIYKITQSARELGDTISTNATQYDMSTKAIQKWEYVAMQSDVETTTLYNSFKKLNSALGDQLVGTTNTATQALEKLGINVNNFKDSDAAFEATIKAISELGSVTEQTAYATDIFGERYASSLIPLFQSGTATIQDYINEFESVGYLSDEQVTSLSNLDNELNKNQKQLELAKTELGISLIPMLEAMTKLITEKVIPAINDLTKWFNSLNSGQQETILTILTLTATLSPLLLIGSKVLSGISAIIKAIPKLITTLKSLNLQTLQTMAGFASLGAAMGLCIDIAANWKQMSAIEVMLKGLAAAAFAAAAAMMVFHATLSVGVAVAAITASIAAGLAVVKAAQNDWSFTSKGSSTPNYSSATIPTTTVNPIQTTTTTNDNSKVDNSTNTYNISIEASEYATAEDVANVLALKLQSRG